MKESIGLRTRGPLVNQHAPSPTPARGICCSPHALVGDTPVLWVPEVVGGDGGFWAGQELVFTPCRW
ncbi:hypothetical protein ETD83_14740 [Actinomadura soli]|uniref:Uncharacterized protein n=1 Tax=Actinomadura soli TaxID=2508997 RepID=A0A5C4JCT0_9ACTN|nr:hypothetical protein [Actinomadura soli]TMR01254.1 hypothetical protein ETD83_14740 [Actinomadura soli]